MVMAMILMMSGQSIYASAQEPRVGVDCSEIKVVSVSDNDQTSAENGLKSKENFIVDEELMLYIEAEKGELQKNEEGVWEDSLIESVEVYSEAEGIVIDETNFPDRIFREYIEINFDKNRNGYLSMSEIEQATSIAISWDWSLTSLQGIKYFIYLETLQCDNTFLSSLDVSGCSSLVYLECSSNKLTSLDVSGCSNLVELYCMSNQLSSLNVSGCSNLETLFCGYNQLSSLNITECANLVKLACNYNQLSSLDLSGYVNLELINTSGNKLSTLNISECANLVELYCESNQIKSLDLIGCTSLEILICSYNQLCTLDITYCLNLVQLECAVNQLSELNVSLLTSLERLFCQSNKLFKLDVGQCTNLLEIICFQNQLSELDISQCPNLEYLNCYDNKLIKLDMSKCKNLWYLYCNYNRLNELNIDQCLNLKNLYCSDNKLSELNVSKCQYLIYLYCSSNLLNELEVTQCPNMKYLSCYNNQLSSLDVSQNTLLMNLSCYSNVCEIAVKTVDITTLAGFDITKVVDGNFTNGILNGNILSPVNSAQPVNYQYDVGWDSPVSFGIKFQESVEDTFSDIPIDSWYRNAVQFVYDNRIMAGKGSGKFDPSGNLTRAEFAMTLYSMEEKPEVSYKDIFDDIPNAEWYTSPVLWVNQIGIASGYGNGKFGVSDNITREQLAMMMYKYATEVCGYESKVTEDVLLSFSDANKVSSWAVKAMEWAVTNGIISGTGDNRLNPQGKALRCECAQILKSFHDKFGN